MGVDDFGELVHDENYWQGDLFDPNIWATRCKIAFFERQPELSRQVWDEIWEAVPYGYRLWVVCLKRTDRVGRIIIPDAAKRTQQEGWVVSVGLTICEPDPHTRQQSPYAHPLDLVGRRVFWGAYTGIDLAPSERPDQDADARNKVYERQYLSLSIADIMGESLKTGGSIL